MTVWGLLLGLALWALLCMVAICVSLIVDNERTGNNR